MLRDDLKWTNGDPVIAGDFEYAWKRTISPELAADYAYQFSGIVGAQEYNALRREEGRLRGAADKVGVNAVDDKTLEVKLTTPQPWFVQQAAHHSFLAVNKKAVESSATSGPRRRTSSPTAPSSSEAWEHNAVDRPRQGRHVAWRG